MAAGASALPAFAAPGPPPYVVVIAGGARSLGCTLANDREMVPLDDLAALFDLVLREDRSAGSLTVVRGARMAVLTPGQALASVGGRLVSLPAPLVRDGKRWLVPVEFVSRVLGPLLDTPIDLRRPSRLVVVGGARVPRVGVRLEPLGGETRVTFEFDPPALHQITEEQGRLLVRIRADYLDVSLPPAAPAGVVAGVRVADPAGTIAIDLGPGYESFRASTVAAEGQPYASRVVISLLASAASRSLPVPAAPPALPLPTAPPEAGLRVVVVDPGHGGEETGARGPAGTLEKELTLTVARRLQAALEASLGVRVLLTRERDETLSLDDRAAFANNNHAGLLVSLHANSAPRREVRGVEVFYLATDRAIAEGRASGAPPQELPVFGGGRRDIEVILWEMAQTRHLAQSAALAAMIEEEIRTRIELGVRPVQQAPFRVLVGAAMPAVLVEMGYLTNAEEEKLLVSPDYQDAIVQGLVSAITRFRSELERVR